jgi:hypothetical protein
LCAEGGGINSAMAMTIVATTDIVDYGWLEPKWLRIKPNPFLIAPVLFN